jgi:hypothetical protein
MAKLTKRKDSPPPLTSATAGNLFYRRVRLIQPAQTPPANLRHPIANANRCKGNAEKHNKHDTHIDDTR